LQPNEVAELRRDSPRELIRVEGPRKNGRKEQIKHTTRECENEAIRDAQNRQQSEVAELTRDSAVELIAIDEPERATMND